MKKGCDGDWNFVLFDYSIYIVHYVVVIVALPAPGSHFVFSVPCECYRTSNTGVGSILVFSHMFVHATHGRYINICTNISRFDMEQIAMKFEIVDNLHTLNVRVKEIQTKVEEIRTYTKSIAESLQILVKRGMVVKAT